MAVITFQPPTAVLVNVHHDDAACLLQPAPACSPAEQQAAAQLEHLYIPCHAGKLACGCAGSGAMTAAQMCSAGADVVRRHRRPAGSPGPRRRGVLQRLLWECAQPARGAVGGVPAAAARRLRRHQSPFGQVVVYTRTCSTTQHERRHRLPLWAGTLENPNPKPCALQLRCAAHA